MEVLQQSFCWPQGCAKCIGNALLPCQVPSKERQTLPLLYRFGLKQTVSLPARSNLVEHHAESVSDARGAKQSPVYFFTSREISTFRPSLSSKSCIWAAEFDKLSSIAARKRPRKPHALKTFCLCTVQRFYPNTSAMAWCVMSLPCPFSDDSS